MPWASAKAGDGDADKSRVGGVGMRWKVVGWLVRATVERETETRLEVSPYSSRLAARL